MTKRLKDLIVTVTISVAVLGSYAYGAYIDQDLYTDTVEYSTL